MQILIKRQYSAKETLGCSVVLNDEGKVIFEFKTLELPNLGNKHMISCIPEGTYEVHKITHVKKGRCFEVLNVPGRDGILIHKGNYATGKKVDSEGCILVGSQFTDLNKDGSLDVEHSTETLAKLVALLPNTFNLDIK